MGHMPLIENHPIHFPSALMFFMKEKDEVAWGLMRKKREVGGSLELEVNSIWEG